MRFTILKYRYTINLTALALLIMLFAYPAAISHVLAETIDGENIQDIFCFVTKSGKASELKTFDVRDPYQVPVTEKSTAKTTTTGHSDDDSETKGHNNKAKFESDSAATETGILGPDNKTIIGYVDADGNPVDTDEPFDHIPGTLSHTEGKNKRSTFESETEGDSHFKSTSRETDRTDKDDVELKKFTVKNKFRVVETPINDANRKIDGTETSDILVGSGCLDTIHGKGGNDYINGGGDGDRLYGDLGDDTIIGNFGSDQIYGGAGNDYLMGGDDSDIILGEDGNDQIYGGTGDNILKGGPGKDYFNCGPEHNVILDFSSAEDKVDDNCKEAQYAH